ncbi:acetyl-CoA synthetase [Halobaculum limi]|uniref:acetyl-CoA synthetase n=1 Tax=Halobaculum limi TaxID=3031916 RepID=UPI002404B028|nr:acetyl-CoA synthetase [Halobaculum sp. YSMS11]
MTEDLTLVGDLVARERRSEQLALHAAELDRTYSYWDLCNTACKVGNVLSHVGIREGDRLVIDPAPVPEPILTFLGGALLGTVTEFDSDPPTDCDARGVVVPVEREAEFDLPGGSKLCAYGGDPERPDTTHWEQEVWSENPAFPPTFHDPADPVLRGSVDGEERTLSHADLLGTARDAVEALEMDAESKVAIRAPLSDPRTVAAGVLAPLLAGGAVAIPHGDDAMDATASVVGAEQTAPESRTLAVDSISI